MNEPVPPFDPTESRLRRGLRLAAFVVALVGLLSVPVLYLSGGFELWIFDVEIRAHRPFRGLWLVVIGLSAFVALGGRLSASRHNLAAAFEWLAVTWDRQIWRRLPGPRPTAIALALVVSVLGATYATRSAGGSDAYGYVSQATDIWMAGRLFIDQPFVAEAPWPRARDTFMPLGYRAVLHDDVPSLVPIYSPGLPLIFAAVHRVAGLDAMYLVVPLLGGVLVLATYGIGVRLGSSGAGVIGALLVACSPAVLFMLMPPMTDVPVAAMWAVTFYLLTGGKARHALGAGAASAVAVMIRPNLVPLAAIAGAYYLPELFSQATRTAGFRRVGLFALGLVPGVLAVGFLNDTWYGSPFLSGYGRLSDLFAWEHIGPNIRNYVTWLVESQSWAAPAGMAALLVPARWLWPGLDERRRLIVAALFVYSTWTQYFAYLVFEAWWYLRFLLSAWPFMMVGIGAIAMAIWHRGGRVVRGAVGVAIASLVVFQVGVVGNVTIFNQWSGERRYIAVAQMVERLTPPNSVIFCMQHSGTVRYYGQRMTLRYDQLDRAWFDRSVRWLGEHGAPSYLLVEPWELPEVTTRFAGAERLEQLSRPPLAIFEEPGRLFLFDLSGTTPGSPKIVTGVDAGLRAIPPGPPPVLNLQPRPE